jgi:hypothetical protein
MYIYIYIYRVQWSIQIEFNYRYVFIGGKLNEVLIRRTDSHIAVIYHTKNIHVIGIRESSARFVHSEIY